MFKVPYRYLVVFMGLLAASCARGPYLHQRLEWMTLRPSGMVFVDDRSFLILDLPDDLDRMNEAHPPGQEEPDGPDLCRTMDEYHEITNGRDDLYLLELSPEWEYIGLYGRDCVNLFH